MSVQVLLSPECEDYHQLWTAQDPQPAAPPHERTRSAGILQAGCTRFARSRSITDVGSCMTITSRWATERSVWNLSS